MGGLFLSVLCMILVLLVPDEYSTICRLLLCIVILGMTALLHKKISAPDAWQRYEL